MDKKERPEPPAYERQVAVELGMYARDSYALYTELFISATPWKDLAGLVIAMQTEDRRFPSNIAAWGSLRRSLFIEFEKSQTGN